MVTGKHWDWPAIPASGHQAGGMRQMGLAQQVGYAMRRARALDQQRLAVEIVLERHSAAPTVVGWARAVLRSDELKPYKLLYRLAESREVGERN